MLVTLQLAVRTWYGAVGSRYAIESQVCGLICKTSGRLPIMEINISIYIDGIERRRKEGSNNNMGWRSRVDVTNDASSFMDIRLEAIYHFVPC